MIKSDNVSLATSALTGLVSRGGLSNWIFFFRADELVMVDVGIMPALKAGIEAGVRKRVGNYGPQRGAEHSDDEGWLLELQKTAKKVERIPYTQINRIRLYKRALAHQLFVDTERGVQKFSLANRKEAEQVEALFRDQASTKFEITSTGAYDFFSKYAPFLNQ